MNDACVDLRNFYDGWKHVKGIDTIDTCPICSNIGFDVILAMIGAKRPGGKPPVGRARVKPDCNQCFLAGTDVLMADGATKDIEDVELGEKVQATDPETGETGAREVTRLIVTEDDKHFNELSIVTEEGVEQLTATYEHPFCSPSENDWIEAGGLKPGMTLLTDEGHTVIVTNNRAYTQHARTYNLTVDDLHTYYVLAGETPVLVHNADCVAGSADAQKPADKLRLESANSPFTEKGLLAPGAIDGSELIVSGQAVHGGVQAGRGRPRSLLRHDRHRGGPGARG